MLFAASGCQPLALWVSGSGSKSNSQPATHPVLSIHDSRFTAFMLFAVSGCRFYCRFWLPFLVAVWQGKIPAWYNLARLRRSDKGQKLNEQTEALLLFTALNSMIEKKSDYEAQTNSKEDHECQ
jgi:hypothetical protein